MSEWEKIMELEKQNDLLKQRILQLENQVNTLKGEKEIETCQSEYWQYVAEIERDKKEKLQQKITRLNKILDSMLKEDK